MSAILHDLRYALRTLCRRPWYAATVVLVLAVGVALATAAFAIVDGVLFRPLPFQRPSELFVVYAGATTEPRVYPAPVGYREIAVWMEAVPDLVMTTVIAPEASGVTGGREIWSATVDERFFDVIGQRPLIGGFETGDFDWNPGPIEEGGDWQPALISHRLWRQEYGGDPDVVGRRVVLSALGSRTYGRRIVGVLPADFLFPLDTGGVQPELVLAIPRLMRLPDVRRFTVLARLPDPSMAGEVSERLTAATRLVASTTVPAPHGHAANPAPTIDDVRFTPLSEHLAGEERPALRIVAAAAGLMLLLACLNVAGLTAARNMERSGDLAVRRALGAGGWQLARLLVVEVAILAAAGTAAAVLLARPLLFGTIALLPSTLTLMKSPELDGRVFVTMAVLAIATVVIVSLWPARVATRVRPQSTLHGRGGTWTPAGRRSRAIVIGAQVGLGFVLLTAGGLSVASFAAAWRTDAGFGRDRLILLEAFVVRSADRADTLAQLTSGAETIARVPGVDEVAISSIQPIFARRSLPWSPFAPPGWQGRLQGVAARRVTDNYFKLMGMRLVDGRWPEPGEWADGRPLAMVSATAARMLWPDRDAIGQSLVRTPARRPPEPPVMVIGVVADARYAALDADPIGDIYLPGPLEPTTNGAYYHALTRGDSAAVATRAAAALTGTGLNVEQAVTHEDGLFAAIKHRALPAWLFGTLGVAALLVVGVGILGLLAMSSVQRTRELGIRVALGATPRRVVGLFVSEQLAPVCWGLAAGAGGSALTVRYVESQLYGVRPYEPAVWAAIALTLAAVAVVGTLVPAIGAARVNPVEALRE